MSTPAPWPMVAADHAALLRSGLQLLTNGIVLLVVVHIGATIASARYPASTLLGLVAAVLTGAAAVMLLVGVVRYTSPQPGFSVPGRAEFARRTARFSAAGLVAAAGGAMLLNVAALWTTPWLVAALVISMLAYASLLVLVAGTTLHTRWVAETLNDDGLRARAGNCAWRLPLMFGLGFILLHVWVLPWTSALWSPKRQPEGDAGVGIIIDGLTSLFASALLIPLALLGLFLTISALTNLCNLLGSVRTRLTPFADGSRTVS